MSVFSPATEHRLRSYAMLGGTLVALGVFLGLVGPFGSYFSGPAWQRIAYWAGLLAFGGIVFGTAARLIIKRGFSTGATAGVLTGATLLLAIPFAAAVSLLAVTLWPRLASFEAIDWYAQVVVIALPLTLAFAFGARTLASRRETNRPAGGAIPPPLGVLPQSVLCLQMEDHYVRVHTAEGSRLVLSSLQQAIAVVQGVPGLQVHRSWWVANAAVAEVLTEGRNLRLRLTNGLLAPVARSSVQAVREAGWL